MEARMTTPRLLDQVRAAIRVRHYSRRTEDAYAHWVRRFISFLSCVTLDMGALCTACLLLRAWMPACAGMTAV
jgi:hypothetical protein